jgi:hypothetical protein
MPLSKNFYEVDDVCAYFLTCLEQQDLLTASHIVNELLISMENERLHTLMIFVWLLSQPCKETSPYRWSALRSRRYSEYLKTFETHPFQVPIMMSNNIAVKSTPNELASVCISIQTMLDNKQVWRAYCFARASCSDLRTIHLCLQTLGFPISTLPQILLNSKYLSTMILHHALYVLAYIPAPMSVFPLPTLNVNAGRILTIPPTVYTRWNIQAKPLSRLIGAPLFVLETSPYWDHQRTIYTLTTNAKNELIFDTDAECEDFYTACFPYDIPDEWSTEERQKSHGAIMNTTTTTAPAHICELLHIIGMYSTAPIVSSP